MITRADRWSGARALVVGATGFIGSHLTAALAQAGADVHGVARRMPVGRQFAGVTHQADLFDQSSVSEIVAEVKPTHIFNVAGKLKPDPTDPEALWRIHVDGTRVLFDVLRALGSRPVVFIASSAAVYGVPDALPVSETALRRGRSAYGASKIGQEDLAFDAMRELGIPVVCARSFNLLGPALSPELLASQVARDIVRAEGGAERVLRIGNLDHRRDFVDIRDAVRAFVDLTLAPGFESAINVCSGFSVPVRVCVDRLTAQARVPVRLEVDQSRLAITDVADIYGSIAQLSRRTEWQRLVPLETSLDHLLEDWRKRADTEEHGASPPNHPHVPDRAGASARVDQGGSRAVDRS